MIQFARIKPLARSTRLRSNVLTLSQIVEKSMRSPTAAPALHVLYMIEAAACADFPVTIFDRPITYLVGCLSAVRLVRILRHTFHFHPAIILARKKV